MNLNLSCQISGQQRDNTIARLVAFQVFAIAVAMIVMASVYNLHIAPNKLAQGLEPFVACPFAVIFSILLFIDFAIRALFSPKFSLLALIGRGLASAFKFPQKMVDAAPKIFAARIGLLLSIIIVVLFEFALVLPALIVTGLLAVAAFLEAAFSFCLGCKIYSLIPSKLGELLSKPLLKEKENKENLIESLPKAIID